MLCKRGTLAQKRVIEPPEDHLPMRNQNQPLLAERLKLNTRPSPRNQSWKDGHIG